MENQIPAPSFPEQNNANSPQPVPAGVAPGAPLGAAPAPALGVAPANVRDRDDSYQRIPDIYRVPAEHRRPYGETTRRLPRPRLLLLHRRVRCLPGCPGADPLRVDSGRGTPR